MPKSRLVPIPRKMFPPPTTRATWTPSPTTSRISADRPARIASSIPYACFPIRASPDSFSRLRRYDGFATQPPQGGGSDRSPLPELLRHLGGQVVRPLFHPLAYLEPGEGANRDRGARGLPRVREELRDLPVRVLDERLLDEAEIAEILLELPVGDLVQDLVGFPRSLGLLAVDRLLALDHRRGHVGPADVRRVGGRHLHRDILGQSGNRGVRSIRTRYRHEDSDLPPRVDVRNDHAGRPRRRFEAREPAEGDLLADLRDRSNQLLTEAPAAGRQRQGLVDVPRRLGVDQGGDTLRQPDEVVGPGHEVGLAVHLDQRPRVPLHVGADDPLGSDPRGLLRGGRQALLR